MLCIIYSMCLFFTAFYRAIFLKSIQLHCEMVVCAAQERKRRIRVPLKEMLHAKTKRATEPNASVTPNQQKNRIHSQRLPINSSLHTTRASFTTPAKLKQKKSCLVNCMLVYFFDFFQYTLVVFPALYTRGRTSGSACFGLNETTFKKFHKDVMHLRYSTTLKGSKKKEKKIERSI